MTSAPQPAHPTRPGRLAVGVIGTGRVGAVLGAALQRVDHRVVAVSAVSDDSKSRAETLLPAASIVSPPEVCAASDLVLVTVPDDQLPGLVDGLAAIDAWRPGQLVAHSSGCYGISVLSSAQEAGAVPLALHPVMTFTGTSIDVDRLAGAFFGVTAPAAFLPVADALVLEMEAEPVHIAEDARPLYHAALAHASNHLVTLMASSVDLLKAAGVDEPRRLLRPLVSAALDNALRLGDRRSPVRPCGVTQRRWHVTSTRSVTCHHSPPTSTWLLRASPHAARSIRVSLWRPKAMLFWTRLRVRRATRDDSCAHAG